MDDIENLISFRGVQMAKTKSLSTHAVAALVAVAPNVIVLLAAPFVIVALPNLALATSSDDAKVTLHAVIDNRERLRSCQVRIHGRRVQPSITGEPFESDVTIRFEFDFPSSLLRIEWQEQVQEVFLGEKANVGDLDAEKLGRLAKSGKPQVLLRVFKYIHTPQYSLHWKSNEEGIVFQHSPEYETEQIMQRFDIRALGFMGGYDFEHGTMLGLVGKNLLQQKIVDCSKMSGPADSNLQRITWVFGPSENLRREIVIDQNRGYTPLHFAVRQRTSSDNAQKETPPIETVDVTWKELSGAWVPATYVQRALAGNKIDSQLELTFDWDSVNAKLDADDFTIERLDPSAKAQVISDQSGKRVQVGYAYPKGQEPSQ